MTVSVACALAFAPAPAAAQSPEGEPLERLPAPDVLEKMVEDHAFVGYNFILAPVGRIVLIRNGPARCAIRFVAQSRDHDEKPPTAFSSGAETERASAQFWTADSAVAKPLELTRKSTFGFARMIVIAPYHDKIRCGHADLVWMYPTGVLILDRDPATQLAWTPLDDFSRIVVDDPALRWIGYDASRRLHVEKLP